VDGYFTITNIEGDTLAALSDPDFDDALEHAFCVSDSCLLMAEVAVSHVTSPGVADGMAFASGENGVGALSYSINGGAFLATPVFNGLDTGEYELVILDQGGCTDTVFFRIEQCQLQMLVTTLPANPGDIGEIHIAVSGANGPVLYALNGGGFQADSFWTMLEPGIYFVTARDSIGCEISDTILISTVSTRVATEDYFIRISPNPGTISFHIAATFPGEKLFVPYSIFNSSGEMIQRGSVVRYNETYRDQFYMVTFPPGSYYVVFDLSNRRIVHRVIKL
jgi:hypothetical protein